MQDAIRIAQRDKLFIGGQWQPPRARAVCGW